MGLPGMSSPRGATRRRAALWSALAMGFVLPSVGCQVEYAGMTLPSGKYMHDDVQYFPRGPEFPWANTQAATQRARMRAMGMDIPNNIQPITDQRPGAGMPTGAQNTFGNPTDVNVSPMSELPAPPAPGIAPAAPEAGVPAPPPPGNP